MDFAQLKRIFLKRIAELEIERARATADRPGYKIAQLNTRAMKTPHALGNTARSHSSKMAIPRIEQDRTTDAVIPG